MTWPNTKNMINLARWLQLLKHLEEKGHILLHEFLMIANDGIIQPMKSYKNLGTPILSFSDNAYWLDLELIAFKLFHQLQYDRLLGPFPQTCTHIMTNKPVIPNSSGKGYKLWRSPVFVVRKPQFKKWREVEDYGAAITGNSLNDIGYQELKHIKYSTVVDRCVAYFGCKFASVLDWADAFKQIPIHRFQWTKFSFNFLGKTYISPVGQFGYYLLPLTFSKFSQTAKLLHPAIQAVKM